MSKKRDISRAICEFLEIVPGLTTTNLVSIMISNDVDSKLDCSLLTAEDIAYARAIYEECKKELKIRLDLKGD